MHRPFPALVFHMLNIGPIGTSVPDGNPTPPLTGLAWFVFIRGKIDCTQKNKKGDVIGRVMCKSTMSLRLDGLISSQYRSPGALAGCLSVTEWRQKWSCAEEVFWTSRHLFPSASRLLSEHVWLLFYFFPSPPSFFLLISQPQSPGHLYRALVSLHGARKHLAWAAQSDCGGFFPPLFVCELHDSSDRPISKDFQKSTAGFARFPLGLPSLFAVCVHPSSGMAPFFVYFFERNRKLCQHTWKIWEKQLVFCGVTVPWFVAFCGCVKKHWRSFVTPWLQSNPSLFGGKA